MKKTLIPSIGQQPEKLSKIPALVLRAKHCCFTLRLAFTPPITSFTGDYRTQVTPNRSHHSIVVSLRPGLLRSEASKYGVKKLLFCKKKRERPHYDRSTGSTPGVLRGSASQEYGPAHLPSSPSLSLHFHVALLLMNCVQFPRFLYVKMACSSPQTSETKTGRQAGFPWIENSFISRTMKRKSRGWWGNRTTLAKLCLYAVVYMLTFTEK